MKNWWIAELSPHGYAGELIDGPHGSKEDAEASLPLFLSVTARKKANIVVACVSQYPAPVTLTRPQARLVEAIDRGEEVIAHERQGHKAQKNWTFSTDADGLRAVLYLSMSAWALIDKGILKVKRTTEGARLCR